jgi:hypothetical protein
MNGKLFCNFVHRTSNFVLRYNRFPFVANYDANVQAVGAGLQITLAQPRRKGDEVSLISTEVYFLIV